MTEPEQDVDPTSDPQPNVETPVELTTRKRPAAGEAPNPRPLVMASALKLAVELWRTDHPDATEDEARQAFVDLTYDAVADSYRGPPHTE